MPFGYIIKKKSNKSKSKSTARGAELLLVLGLVLLMFYMWGRVKIDTVLREQARLEVEKNLLTREIGALRIEVNTMKSYSHIAARAKDQGMDVLPASRRAELAVDADRLTSTAMPKMNLQSAGVGIVNLHQRE